MDHWKFLQCRRLLKEVVLFAESEHEEVMEELAALYTDVLLQPCQASPKAAPTLPCAWGSLISCATGHLRRLGGRKCELTVDFARMPPGHTRLSATGLIRTLRRTSSTLEAKGP
jgi:hypothetical protein